MLNTRRRNTQSGKQVIPHKLAQLATKDKKLELTGLTEERLSLLAKKTKKVTSQSPFASTNERLSKRSTCSYTPSIADRGISDMSYACSEADPRDRCPSISASDCESVKPRTPLSTNTTINITAQTQEQPQPACRPKTCTNSTQTETSQGASSRTLLRQYAMTSRLDCKLTSSLSNTTNSASSDNEQAQPAEKRDKKDYKSLVYDGYVRPRMQEDELENLESMFHSRNTSELYFPKRKQASKAKIIRAAALYRF